MFTVAMMLFWTATVIAVSLVGTIFLGVFFLNSLGRPAPAVTAVSALLYLGAAVAKFLSM